MLFEELSERMMIETERLIVRSFREEDADALYRIKTDSQVMIKKEGTSDVLVTSYPDQLMNGNDKKKERLMRIKKENENS